MGAKDREYIDRVIRVWTERFSDLEPTNVRLTRALLLANAAVNDYRRALLGREPIRPLEDYPRVPVEEEG